MELVSDLSFDRIWGSFSLRAVVPEQISKKIADFGESYFKNFSFSYLKESKWTYIVIGSVLFIASLVKISRLSHQLLKKEEELNKIEEDIKIIATRSADKLNQIQEDQKNASKELETLKKISQDQKIKIDELKNKELETLKKISQDQKIKIDELKQALEKALGCLETSMGHTSKLLLDEPSFSLDNSTTGRTSPDTSLTGGVLPSTGDN